MKVDIILITYNQSKYIRQCLDSLIMQMLNCEIEVIVADDCSTDNTLSLIKDYSLNCSIKFTYLNSSRNIGFVKNYQRAFAACMGDYVAILEGDDYWIDPKRLQKHVNFLENHSKVVLTMNRYISFNEPMGNYKCPDWVLSEDYQYITGSDMALENRLGNLSACVLKKNALDKLKPDIFDMLIADWMIGMALCQHGLIAILKEATSVYRIHNMGQWSKMNMAEQLEKMNLHINEYNKYLEYKYDTEFELHKNRLNVNTSQPTAKKVSIKDFVPPIGIYILKKLQKEVNKILSLRNNCI